MLQKSERKRKARILISVIIQIGVGALTYVGCLFILKDEMIISTLEKIKKGKFGKWKKLNS